jgi:UPF0716 protein FxsA
MRLLFLLLFIIPLIELYFLIQVGEEIGALPTILLTIFTAMAGIALMRMQGLAIMQKAQISMASGQPPQMEVMEGVFIFLGGIFLFLPGLITDGIGFLFLMPFVRHFLIKLSVNGMQSRGRFRQDTQQNEYYEGEWSETTTHTRQRIETEIIEGEVIEPEDSAKKP